MSTSQRKKEEEEGLVDFGVNNEAGGRRGWSIKGCPAHFPRIILPSIHSGIWGGGGAIEARMMMREMKLFFHSFSGASHSHAT